MDRVRVLRAAQAELEALGEPRLWMTARGLAARLRANSADLRSLSQERLYAAMANHAEHSENRVLRNSPYPSEHTLEVLWGATARVGELAVEPPQLRAYSIDEEEQLIKSRLRAAAAVPADTEVAVPIDFFLSYNHRDSAAAVALTDLLERKGYSVWMAGAAISVGDVINDTVRRAMADARCMLLYLSSYSLRSLWVAKEQLVAVAGDLPRVIVAKGDDEDLIDLVLYWMSGSGDDQVSDDAFGGLLQVDALSYAAAVSFREQLRDLVEDGDEQLYLFPSGSRRNRRLRSIESFPVRGQ